MRHTPSHCPRNTECQPLHNIASDDGTTFVCCGLHDEDKEDRYRFCFKSETTDTKLDYDELDLLDTVEVAVRALTTGRRLTSAARLVKA